MKIKEELKTLRTKKTDLLYKELQDEYINLHKHRFSAKFRNLKDITKINKTKKKIARILTVIREKI